MSRAQSQEGSSWPGADSAWIEHVRWDGEFHPFDDVTYDQRPEVLKLREIVDKSFIVPAWMADIESPEWAFYNKRRLCVSASKLSSEVSGPQFTQEKDDEELSFDVQESLASILNIPRHAASLETHRLVLEPMESDRRHPVDTLSSLVWDLQSDERVVYRTERKLAIPSLPRQARREYTSEVQPDACAFIPLGINPALRGVLTNARAALSCFPSTDSLTPHHRYVLHWVTEYKRDLDKLDSTHQVAEGMVSALYQRRAYGFPNHFVFGSAHYSRTIIEVLAATWVRSDEPADPRARSQEAKTASAVPTEDQKTSPPGNLLQESDATSSLAKTSEEAMGANTNLTIQDIGKYNKVLPINWFMTGLLTRAQIVMYSIATYNMAVTEDMLQLYLLMRHTLTLAQQYKGEIEGDKDARVRELMKEAKEFYEWPPPPRPQSNRGTKRKRTRSSESNSFASVSERQSDGMSIEPYEDPDCSSDSEELEPSNDAGPTRRIAGEVASYTVRNYAYEEDAEA
ncbi:hypothetical protein V565_206980 [Rhizoctonia solani 123E]|uniref:Uncharacterized protein n=1 Tax=Rhizoctonia solani 123E TaxID=1423351 RepID=A0A074RLU2_9AGAM|nr:hypothetical protein V565_206980 [Rhizoctonia solani 123E]